MLPVVITRQAVGLAVVVAWKESAVLRAPSKEHSVLGSGYLGSVILARQSSSGTKSSLLTVTLGRRKLTIYMIWAISRIVQQQLPADWDVLVDGPCSAEKVRVKLNVAGLVVACRGY